MIGSCGRPEMEGLRGEVEEEKERGKRRKEEMEEKGGGVGGQRGGGERSKEGGREVASLDKRTITKEEDGKL